jgi:hypothetical protein
VFPTESGFLCDFSAGADCPVLPVQIGTVQLPVGSVSTGGPRSGTAFTFTVDDVTGTIHLDYDLSANPATGSGNRDFFGLALAPLVPFDGTATFYNTPGTYDLYFTSTSCEATLNGTPATCKSDTPIIGVDFNTPEPPLTWLLVLGTASLFWCRRKSTLSKRSAWKVS